MVVWIYDEEGYPSGAAGGLVLQENPAFEALELAFDASRDEPFIVRPSYEFTHANNNYHASRRYINLLGCRGGGLFRARRRTMSTGSTWSGFSATRSWRCSRTNRRLLAVSLGQIPEHVRRTVKVVDPPDPQRQAVACRTLVPGSGRRVPGPIR